MDILSRDEHPNRDEICAVLDRIPRLDGEQLAVLALNWKDTFTVSTARDLALGFQTPLLTEVLQTYDDLDLLEAAAVEMDALRRSSAGVLDGDATCLAFGAVRDAVAGAYAQPTLLWLHYDALMRPWWALSRLG